MITELKRYLRDLQRGQKGLPNLIIVARDANCKGVSQRKKEIEQVAVSIGVQIICAVPNPHIQRWMLIDSAAFKKVFGMGCSAPDQKCERDRYKHLLLEAVRAAGVSPPLGGMEYAENIVNAMELHPQRVRRRGASLASLLVELHNKFKEWSRT